MLPEWWDTITGAPTRTESLAVGSDGRLTLTVTGLAGDIAVKFSNTASSGPKQATIALRRGWNLMALPLIPTESTRRDLCAGRWEVQRRLCA